VEWSGVEAHQRVVAAAFVAVMLLRRQANSQCGGVVTSFFTTGHLGMHASVSSQQPERQMEMEVMPGVKRCRIQQFATGKGLIVKN